MSLAATIGGSGPTISFNGFPSTTPSASTSNGITLTPTVTDTYSASGAGYTGFYLQSSNTIKLMPTVPSSTAYTLSVAPSIGGSASYSFYYDTIQITNPTVSSTAFSFYADPSSIQISGVYVVYGTPIFTVTTTATNMGNYFYKSPLMTYVNKINGTTLTTYNETTTANITAGLSAGQFTTGTITVTNNALNSSSLSTTYGNALQMTTTGNNFNGASTGVNASSITSMVDGLSFTLIRTTLPQTLPSLSSSVGALGYRVSSGTVNPSNILYVPDISNSVIYANTAYDNTASIAALQELQVSNGAFTTPGAQTYSYQNYSTYYYTNTLLNTVNYSSPSNYNGYRFTTFAWRLPQPSGNSYSTLTFRMNGTTTQLSNVSSVACISTTPIILYYRFEDAAQAVPTGTSSISSAWLNGNSVSGTPTGSGNYFLSNTNYYANLGLTIAPTTTTFSVFCLNNAITTQTVNLYCRVGLPMASSIAFTSITATISI